jgi:hypothetical protein
VLENANAFAENHGGVVDNECTPWAMRDPDKECAPMPRAMRVKARLSAGSPAPL